MNSDRMSARKSQSVHRGLTARQTLFVAEYVIDPNATRAAVAAGYSEKGARVRGAELLANRNISDEITKRTGKRLGKLEINADRVLQELARIAFFDPRKLFNADGSPKQVNELDDDTAAAITGLEVRELFAGTGDHKHPYGLSRKYRLADKRGALELLGKRLNLFNRKDELCGPDGAPLRPPDLIIQFTDERNPNAPPIATDGKRTATPALPEQADGSGA